MSPVEFYYALKDVRQREQCHYETTFESMRVQTMYLWNIQVDPKHRIHDAQKFMPFIWDKKRPVKKQTVDEMKQILQTITSRIKKKGAKNG
jgi:hypothetical protein